VKKPRQLLVHHGVARDRAIEFLLLLPVGQLPEQQQVADFEKVALLGKLLDRIAAVQKLYRRPRQCR